MALVKQTLTLTLTLTLIFVSAHIISTITVDARFALWPAGGAPADAPAIGPTQEDTEEADKGFNPSDLTLPDIIEILPEDNRGTNADVAKTIAEQMQVIEKKIDEFNAALKARMDTPKASEETKECVAECDEVFGAAVDDIKNTLDSLNSDNLVKAKFDVSAVATNVDTCNDCFNEMVCGDPEVEKFGDWVRSITGEALEALQKATN